MAAETRGSRARVGEARRRAARARFRQVRARTLELVAPLAPEDMVLQSMTEASPTRWHLAHTTWFFEAFVLERFAAGYRPFDPAYAALFNSYYETVGDPFPRARRGMLSRPTVDEVRAYRAHVDEAMDEFLADGAHARVAAALEVLEIGTHHEEQHQELILGDVLHALAQNPLRPAVVEPTPTADNVDAPPMTWCRYDGGVLAIGADDDGERFRFDNERPRHDVLVGDFEIASRPVTNGEWLAFMADGGYDDPALWLADGWGRIKQERWAAPLHWERRDDGWWRYTLAGLVPVHPAEPVCHVSYYEADAFATWAGARLPSEAEWEVAAAGHEPPADEAHVRLEGPRPADEGALVQVFGAVWAWTASAYAPYPGFEPFDGSLAEYNGKFMCNQQVCRGGSAWTPPGHVRATYRNFFPPDARWQMLGLRLARATGGGTA